MTSFKTLVLKSKVLPRDKSQDKLGLTRPSFKGQNLICEPLAGEAKWFSSRSRTRTHNSCCDSDLRQWGQSGSTERISSGLPLQMRLFPLNTKIFQIQVPTHRKSTNWGPPRVPAPTSPWSPGNKTSFPPEAGTHHAAVCTHSNSNSGRQRSLALQDQLIPQSNTKHFQPSQPLQACTQIHFFSEINWANSYWYGQGKSFNLSFVSGRNTMHFNFKISAYRALLELVAWKILVIPVAM